MRVVFVLTELATGGAEIFTLQLAAALQGYGHDVTLVTLRGEATDHHLAKIHWPNAHIIHYRHPWLQLILKIDGLLDRLRLDRSFLRFFQIRYLRRLLSALQPDLIHSHLFSADFLVLRALDAADTPWVTTIHGDYLACAKSCHWLHHHHRHFFSRSARIDRRINQVVLISEPQREAMSELFPVSCQDGRHRLIINGLSLPDSEQISPRQLESMRSEVGLLGDGLIIGMVARGIADKGWDVLLHAFEIAGLPDAELLLIGDGPALRQLSKRFHSPRIHFYGSSSEPHKLMRLCDLTCLPSRYASESCPLAVAESLSVGVPVIATRVGQISWMVDEQTEHPAGITLPLEDPEPLSHALANVLTTLHQNREHLAILQRNCLQAKLKFSMDHCVKAYLQAYQSAAV